MYYKIRAGLTAGFAAGLVRSVALMSYLAVENESIWTYFNLMGAIWQGPEVAHGQFVTATVAGMAIHLIASMLLGVAAIPFIDGLAGWKLLLNAFTYGLAAYPFIFAFVLSWANPVMVERMNLVAISGGQALFGIVLGVTYAMLCGREASRMQNRRPGTIKNPGP